MSTQDLANSFNLRQVKANPNKFQSISGYKNMSWPNSLFRQLNVKTRAKKKYPEKVISWRKINLLAKQDEVICFYFLYRTWNNIQIPGIISEKFYFLFSEKGMNFRMYRNQRTFANTS